MKTIEVKLYSFDELSEEAKEKAINKYRDNEFNYTPWFMEEANNTFKKFADLFSIKWRNIDYLQSYRNEYSIKIDDNILNLNGQRLATYIWNNYKKDLFKGKFYFKDCYIYPNGGTPENDRQYKRYIKRYSKIFLETCCVLTGVCYDDDILRPIYEFLEKPNDRIDFKTLLNDCIYSLCGAVSDEYKYQMSDDAISETIRCNGYEFTEDGEIY